MFEHSPTRIVLVDDHALLREGLRRILERELDLEIVGEAETGEAALELVAHLIPDIVLMDVRMPGMDGIEATRRLGASHPQVQVLVLSAYPEFTREALQAGAAGYLLKLPWSPRDRGRQTGVLSGRERDILRLITRGLTNRAIAHELGIAPRTADQHVHNMLVKIGAGSRSEAVRYAIEHELISVG